MVDKRTTTTTDGRKDARPLDILSAHLVSLKGEPEGELKIRYLHEI